MSFLQRYVEQFGFIRPVAMQIQYQYRFVIIVITSLSSRLCSSANLWFVLWRFFARFAARAFMDTVHDASLPFRFVGVRS